jgi:hypothetical protein
MEDVQEVLLMIGVLLVGVMILFIGAEFAPLLDRGPQYISQNLALTKDSVTAAPENVNVVYDLPRDEWKSSSTFDKIKHPIASDERVVASVIFESNVGRVIVSRYSVCTSSFMRFWNGVKQVGSGLWGGVKDFGAAINPFAVADLPRITGNLISIDTRDLSKEINNQQKQSATYTYMSNNVISHKYTPNDCLAGWAISDVVTLGTCKLAENWKAFKDSEDHAYNRPDKFTFNKKLSQYGKNILEVSVACRD